MLVTCKMKSSAKAFFQVLEDSAKDELVRFGKMEADVSIAAGMAYSKVLKQGKRSSRVIVKITDFEAGSRYQTRIKNSDGQISEITYLVVPEENGGCTVTYEENLFGTSGVQDERFRTWLFGVISGRQIKRQLKLIDKKLQEKH